MTRILIEEWTGGPNGTNARVSFNGGPVYPVTVIAPFTPEQEQRLEWYFEEYLNFPSIKQVRAREAAASIATYGEQLFAQVFADRHAYAAYVQYKTTGINTLHFEIAGSFAFHVLHWEALKDPDLPHPFVLDATMVRKNLIPAPAVATMRPSPTINILVVTARPDGQQDVNYRTISRPMIEALRQANLKARIDLVRPGTYMALSQHLEQPQLHTEQGTTTSFTSMCMGLFLPTSSCITSVRRSVLSFRNAQATTDPTSGIIQGSVPSCSWKPLR